MNNQNELLRYAGMATQFLVVLGLTTFIGFKADGYFKFGHILTVSLPLLALLITFYKIFKETKYEK